MYQTASEYLAYFEHAAHRSNQQDEPGAYDSEAIISMFRPVIGVATDDLAETPGHRSRCSALVCPAISNISAWGTAYGAFSTLPDDDDRSFMRRYGARAACETYDFSY
jgi:hypothetical protein